MNTKWIVSPLLAITLVLVLGLTACGPQSAAAPTAANTPTNGSPSSATQAANNATPTRGTTITATQPPTGGTATSSSIATAITSPGVQKCGMISTLPVQLQGAAPPQQVGGCFWQAYQQCSPAIMILNANGVDMIVTHVLLIEKKDGACVIADTLSKGLAPKPPTVTNYVCTSMTNSNDALHVTGCGSEGDITIPLH